jgi:transcription elongation factor Elf1
MMHLSKRTSCPSCHGPDSTAIYSAPYASIQPFLRKNYGDQDFSMLTEYILARCHHCSLVYQVNIPDDDLALAIYDRWIDPEKTKRSHLEKDLQHRLGIAPEPIREKVARAASGPIQGQSERDMGSCAFRLKRVCGGMARILKLAPLRN